MNDEKNPSGQEVVSILVPAYNERAYLRRCVEQILKAPLEQNMRKEIIIVDDGSNDGTQDLVRELEKQYPDTISAFFQDKNQGKGAAIRRAISEMTGNYAIFQDADLEYDPSEYHILLKPILDGRADVVYGSRFVTKSMRRVFNYHHALGNKFLTHLSNVTTGLDLTDMETCYKAFRGDILKTIPIRSNRFGIEPEITAKIAKRDCLVYEVPISYFGRSYIEGKKIGWKDGVAAIYYILKFCLIDDCYNERYGHAILHSLSSARRLNNWMVKTIQAFLGARILEVGSGIGSISRLLPHGERLTLSDLDPLYLRMLRQAFRNYREVDVVKLDLTEDGDFNKDHLKAQYDTIVCLNVLEHIEDDIAALRRMSTLLSAGGRVIVLVPQYDWLMCNLDREAGHYRRYTKKRLASSFQEAGISIERIIDFNFWGLIGWSISARLLGRTKFGRIQLKVFDLLVPFMKQLEKICRLPGLSIIAIGRKE